MFLSSAYAQTAEGIMNGAEKSAEHGGRVFPPFDFSYFGSHLFWLVVFFGLFYLFIARVIVPCIGGTIETRRDRIAYDLDQAASMKQEADSAVALYEEELSKARAHSHVIAQEAADQAKAEFESERKQIEAALEQKLADAEGRIAQIRDKAMQDVGTIAEEITAELVNKLIGVSVSEEKVSNAVKAVRR